MPSPMLNQLRSREHRPGIEGGIAFLIFCIAVMLNHLKGVVGGPLG